MQPSDSVHHETIRLVSLNLRLRNRIAAVVSTNRLLCESLLGAQRSREFCRASVSDADLRRFTETPYKNCRFQNQRCIAFQKELVRNLRSRGLFPDADSGDGNCSRARRRQRAATSRAHWKRQLATYVPSAAAPQLPVVFLGATRLAGWHVDAAN